MDKHAVLFSILASEIFYCYEGTTAYYEEILPRLIESGFYQGIETCVIPPAHASRISELTKAYHIRHVQWLTRGMLEQNVNPCAVGRAEHDRACAYLKDQARRAADAGAAAVALISGDDPGEDRRAGAKSALADTLAAVCDCLKDYPSVALLLEPLDRTAHKRQLIGPTQEAVAFLEALRPAWPAVGLSWDSAHAALNGENLEASLTCALPVLEQVHFAEAVLEEKHPLYGDYHLMIGHPHGFLRIEKMESLLRLISAKTVRPLYVSLEVRTEKDEDAWETERRCRRLWQRVTVPQGGVQRCG